MKCERNSSLLYNFEDIFLDFLKSNNLEDCFLLADPVWPHLTPAPIGGTQLPASYWLG
jgi:hypothetical protein